jgi:hypothetical protein
MTDSYDVRFWDIKKLGDTSVGGRCLAGRPVARPAVD